MNSIFEFSILCFLTVCCYFSLCAGSYHEQYRVPRVSSENWESFVYSNKEYLIQNLPVNWENAKILCRGYHNGTLAILETKEAAEFLAEALSESQFSLDSVWVGARRDSAEDPAGYRWNQGLELRRTALDIITLETEGDTKHYPVWLNRTHIPVPEGGADCVALERVAHDKPVFLDLPCSLERAFACERDTKPHAQVAELKTVRCRAGLYHVYDGRMDWNQAAAYCALRRMSLANIASLKCLKKLGMTMLKTRPSIENAWIGARGSLGRWTWVDSGVNIFSVPALYDALPLTWPPMSEEIEKEFPKIFDNLGTFKDSFLIKLIESPKPFVQTTPRVVPIPLLDKVKQELNRLESLGVISQVEEPTMFVSPIVVVPKEDGTVRICGDYTQVNKNILRPIFPIPRVETTLGRLKGARVFSKIDATSGFYQINLNEESKKLTTILTPFGRFMYNRLPMGLNCAPEYFSMKFNNLFQNLEGVVIHVDDILLFTGDRKSHNILLKEVLGRLSKEGLTINKNKCVFGVEEITYLGHVINDKGVSLDPDRVESIKQFRVPNNKKELMQFLGLVNYVGRFIPNKTNILQPLNDLLRMGVPFHWDIYQEKAFKEIKYLISNSPTLTHYDPCKKIIISADSSSYGLGAVLMQESQSGEREVISFASRTLNNTEKNYAQIEKECLALSWAVYKFRDYVVGVKVVLETDHKPLLQILQTKPIDDLTPRLLRFRLQLMRYSYEVVYVPGKKLVVADALSRAPLSSNAHETKDVYVSMLTDNCIEDDKLSKIKQEQQSCELCNCLVSYTLEGWPERSKISLGLLDYYQFRHNFSVQEGFLLYNSRLVIPKSLQKHILDDIHKGHLGITKCRERAKQSVWWLGLSSQIKVLIENCPECIQEKNNCSEPLYLDEMPSRAWQKVGMDLFKYDNKWYLVIIDYYSRFIELFNMHDLSEVSLIKHCKETFARYGVPEIVRTDCGTQFKSKFSEFSKEYNFVHVTSSPYFPQSNGCAEAGVKIAKSLLKKNTDIYLALLSYRNTPLETGYSPSELVFNRKIREILPVFPDKLNVRTDTMQIDFKAKRMENREKMSNNYNKRHKAICLKDLEINDQVWVIDLRAYGTIVRKAKEPRSYYVQVNGVNYRRNRWHLVPAPFRSISNKREQRFDVNLENLISGTMGNRNKEKDVQVNEYCNNEEINANNRVGREVSSESINTNDSEEAGSRTNSSMVLEDNIQNTCEEGDRVIEDRPKRIRIKPRDPTSIKQSGCLQLDRHSYHAPHFLEARCERKMQFICYQASQTVPTLRTSPVLPSDDLYYYVLVKQLLYWQHAFENCQKMNGTLARLDNNDVLVQLLLLMGENKEEPVEHIWISGRLNMTKDVATETTSYVWFNPSTGKRIPDPKSFGDSSIGYMPPWLDEDFTMDSPCLNLDRQDHLNGLVYGLPCDTAQYSICIIEKTTKPTNTGSLADGFESS